MPASHAGDHRSKAGQGHQFHFALKALLAMHSLGKRIQLGANPSEGSIFAAVPNGGHAQSSQSSQRSSGFHKPALSGAAPETATISASTQQSADFFCKETLPVQPRLEAPLLFARVAQCRGTTSRASPVQVRVLPRAPFRPASIKVMQRTFNPLNRERYPGGPPF